ncbi:MAG TPA: beta-phosphoglucomutase family hydrolase [Acidimicrobiia bacterium]|jgi:alpha,alpha-trehalase
MAIVDWQRYRAVLFDLDGVLTATAKVHSAAWRRAFDSFLEQHEEGLEPFDIDSDYRRYVDGKPRFDGVSSFLDSRGIDLPWGEPSDPAGYETVCAVGNLKNDLFESVLEDEGADVYPGSLALLDHLAELEMPIAVVSASANCEAVLRSVGILDRFHARVDGIVAAEVGLRGKPKPDPFLEAARRLDTPPAGCVVVEDAISGVEAGRAGGFGLVVGVDRHGDPDALHAAGADIVVSDLGELVP